MLKHHKKTNIGVIFECLIQETVSSFVEGTKCKADIAWSILDRYFLSPGAPLGKELAFYEAISEARCNKELGKEFLKEIESLASKTNKSKLNESTKKLLEEISSTFGESLLDRYIDNYRLLASTNMLIEAYRRDKTPLTVLEKSRLEEVILEHLNRSPSIKEESKELVTEANATDPVILNMAYKKFNKKYEDRLTKSQLDVVYTAMCNESALPGKVQVMVDKIKALTPSIKDPSLRTRINEITEVFTKEDLNLVAGLKYAQLLDEMEA